MHFVYDHRSPTWILTSMKMCKLCVGRGVHHAPLASGHWISSWWQRACKRETRTRANTHTHMARIHWSLADGSKSVSPSEFKELSFQWEAKKRRGRRREFEDSTSYSFLHSFITSFLPSFIHYICYVISLRGRRAAGGGGGGGEEDMATALLPTRMRCIYIFNRNGVCLYYHAWHRPLTTLSAPQDHKLMFGLLFSLRSFTLKMDPTRSLSLSLSLSRPL